MLFYSPWVAMTKIYSTEELINILATERRACINGHRLHLTATPCGINPLIDRFLKPDGIQKFTAYDNFRQTVHGYQREHQVSGIVWQCLRLRDKTLCFPKIDDQLISLNEDLLVLRAAKSAIVNFWRSATDDMDLYLSLHGGKRYQAVSGEDVERIIQRSEWVSLCHHGKAQNLEVILQLGWGRPEMATYRRGFPESGSEYVHAVYPGHYPLS
jgi:hypothetical protein